jgi:hypothetical protein
MIVMQYVATFNYNVNKKFSSGISEGCHHFYSIIDCRIVGSDLIFQCICKFSLDIQTQQGTTWLQIILRVRVSSSWKLLLPKSHNSKPVVVINKNRMVESSWTLLRVFHSFSSAHINVPQLFKSAWAKMSIRSISQNYPISHEELNEALKLYPQSKGDVTWHI